MENTKKINWYTLAFMAFSTVWGFGNVLNGFEMCIRDRPFSMPVLLEKIRVILRRSDGMDGKRAAENCLRCRDLTLSLIHISKNRNI